MRRFLFVVLAATLFGIPLFADAHSCTAMKGTEVEAQKVRNEAVSLRDAGQFDEAAAKYVQAAGMHPLGPAAASYLMNAVGCKLSQTYHPSKGYRWGDGKRGVKNAAEGRKLLSQVKALLEEFKDCSELAGLVASTKAWHGAQVKWLDSQVSE